LSGGSEKYMDITASKGMNEKWHNEELLNPYSSSDIIVVFTSRMIRWMRHVGQLREIRNA
jgi:hypothetical protein